MDWETLKKIRDYLGGTTIVTLILGLLGLIITLLVARFNLRPQRRKQEAEDRKSASDLLKKAKDCWYEAKQLQKESLPDSSKDRQDLERTQKEQLKDMESAMKEKLDRVLEEEREAFDKTQEAERKAWESALEKDWVAAQEERKALKKIQEDRKALERGLEEERKALEKRQEEERKAWEKTQEEERKAWERAQKEKSEKKEKLVEEYKDYLDDVADLDSLTIEQYWKGFLLAQDVRAVLEEEGFPTKLGDELRRVEARLGWIVYRKTYIRNWRILQFPLHRLFLPTRFLYRVLDWTDKGDDLVERLSKVAGHRSTLKYAPRSLREENHPVWRFGLRSADVLEGSGADIA